MKYRLLIFTACLWELMIAFSGATLAAEQARPGVVIVSLSECCSSRYWAQGETSIAKELALLDISFRFSRMETSCESTIDECLNRVAEPYNADAVVMIQIISLEPLKVGIVVRDNITDKTISKSWFITKTDSTDDAMFAGLRTVDTLRASLLENQMEKQAPGPIQKPVGTQKLADTTTLHPRRPRRFELSAGAGVALNTGDAPNLAGFEAGVSWLPVSAFGIRLSVAWYPIFGEVSSADVTSDLDILTFRGWLVWRIGLKRVSPEFSLGGGSFIVLAEGIKGDERLLKHDISMIGYAGVGMGLNIKLTQMLMLRPEFRLGVTIPEVRMFHGEERVAIFGRPLWDGGISLVAAF